MKNMDPNRFWSDLAGRWQTEAKDELPETDSSVIETGPDDLDDIDEELDEILGDLDI